MEDQGEGLEVVGEQEGGGVGVLVAAGVERARVSNMQADEGTAGCVILGRKRTMLEAACARGR